MYIFVRESNMESETGGAFENKADLLLGAGITISSIWGD